MARNRLAEVLFGPARRGPAPPARPPARRVEPATPARVTALEPFEADPGAPAAPGVAQLRIVRAISDGEPVFGVSGHCCCADLPYHAPGEYGRPGLSLGTLMSREAAAGGAPPAKTLHWMRGWSESKRPLVGWLNRLRRVHGDRLRLIIWDDTDFDIPWELLWLPGEPGDGVRGGWLGAEVAVSRRTTLHGPAARPAARCSGEVVGFVDESDLEIAGDLPILRDLGMRTFPSFRDLVSYLEEAGAPPSLVYVACHGSYSVDGFEFTLGELPLGELNGRVLRRLAGTDGLVFLNACHSGRLIIEERFNDKTLRGFAKVFLASGAAGLIGTAAEVGTRSAREAARTLIRRLRDEPGTPVAVALRDYRRSLAPDDVPPVRDVAANQALLQFMYAFVYIYYGDPHSTVRLVPAAGKGGAT
ncbi:CHAT domain-containing protein [Actinomadura vinacea]|uniref:CHAT domain-containing protein n=1 Tax=Actinomadura vinacea TaxID=115336 RepID=A0ABN3J707_9ACTN